MIKKERTHAFTNVEFNVMEQEEISQRLDDRIYIYDLICFDTSVILNMLWNQ